MGLLGGVTDAFEFPELLAPEQVNVHVDAFLHWCNFREDTADVEEGFYIALAQDGSKALAGCR